MKVTIKEINSMFIEKYNYFTIEFKDSRYFIKIHKNCVAVFYHNTEYKYRHLDSNRPTDKPMTSWDHLPCGICVSYIDRHVWSYLCKFILKSNAS